MTSKPWTTKEIQDAKRVYYTGGSAAVCKLLPHRTRQAIQAQAQIGKWPLWTTINEGTIAAAIIAALGDGEATTTEIAVELGRPTLNVSAILCQLHKRGVLTRRAAVMELSNPLNGKARTQKQTIFIYRVNPKWTEATKQ